MFKVLNNTVILHLCILIGILTSFGISCEDEDIELNSFSIRSVIRLIRKYETNGNASIDFDDNSILEVEEIYDKLSASGKLTVLNNNGFKSELFIREREKLFMELSYNSNNTIKECNMEQARPVSGYFGLFSSFNSLLKNKDIPKYLIGPGILLFKYREALMKEFLNKKVDTKIETHRRRLFVDPMRIEFEADNGIKVAFKQSDFMIDRSPLLSKLAAFASFEDRQTNTKFLIDFLTIDTDLDISPSSVHNVVSMKLPIGFSCSQLDSSMAKTLEIQKGILSNLKNGWIEEMYFYGRRLSASFHSLQNSYPGGVEIMMDFARHLFRFDLVGKSRSVLDIHSRILYHMPLEPAIKADTENDVLWPVNSNQSHQIRNDECTIISSDAFEGFELLVEKKPQSKTLGSMSEWNLFVGETDYMMYLGLVRYGSRLAHEFELIYDKPSQLPTFFMILMTNMAKKSLAKWCNKNPSDVLVGRLYILNDDGCNNLLSPFPYCHKPIFLGFNLKLIDTSAANSIKWQEEFEVSKFGWDFYNYELSVKPYEAFELRKCPLERAFFSQEVKWKQETSVAPTSDICQHKFELEEYHHDKLVSFLDIWAHSEVSLIKTEQRTFPGAKVAKYSIEIAQEPKWMNDFKIKPNSQLLHANLIDYFSEAKSQFECLTWASQFGNAKSVMLDTLKGCYVYDEAPIEQDPEQTKEVTYDLFERVLKDSNKNGLGLKSFIGEHLEQINNEIETYKAVFDKNEVCLNKLSLLKGVSLQKIKKVGDVFSINSLRASTRLIKSSYRFEGEGDNVYSFIECSRKCDQDPNCGSLAYCKYPEVRQETCQISQDRFFSTNISEQTITKLVRDGGCEIHAKDFLTNFNRLNIAQLENESLLNKWLSISPGGVKINKQECAATCFDKLKNDESCTKFISCKGNHINGCFHLISNQKNNNQQNESSITPAQMDSDNCEAYERKFIGLYRQTMSYENSSWNDPEGELIETSVDDLSKEECAKRCTDDMDCESFDTCSEITMAESGEEVGQMKSTTRKTNQRFFCLLLTSSTYNGIKLLPKEKNPDKAKKEERLECNHYERIGAHLRLSSEQVKEIMRSLNKTGSKTNKASNWISWFALAMLGIGLGMGSKGLVSYIGRLRRRDGR